MGGKLQEGKAVGGELQEGKVVGGELQKSGSDLLAHRFVCRDTNKGY